MNYLTPNKIVNDVIKYINDPRQDEAILIDGDWGINKTFFTQNTLIDKIKKNIKRSHDKERAVIYISLYKIETCKQISDELGLNNVITLQRVSRKENTTRQTNILSKIAKTGISFFNTETSQFPGVSDCSKTQKSIIVFDDFQRCSIKKDVVLSYINDLVEHGRIKAILVDNEPEIIEPKTNKNALKLIRDVNFNRTRQPLEIAVRKDSLVLDIENVKSIESVKSIENVKNIENIENNIKQVHEIQNMHEINECFDDEKCWGTNFHAYCKTNHNIIMKGNRFVSLMDTDKLLEKIITSDTENIYEFNRGIDVIYSFSNLNDFFKDDEQGIRDFVKKLRMEMLGDLSNSSDTKKTALDRTKRKFEESLKLIISVK